MRQAQFVVATFVVGVVSLAGCGSSEDSTFGDGNDPANGGGSHDLIGGTGSTGTSGGAAGGGVGNVNPGDACATSNAGTTLAPVSLVFMIDRSGSMGSGNSVANKPLRWDPVVAGLKAFFADPASANLEGSIAFFPILSGGNEVCTTSAYAAPVVAMTALPNATAFSAALDGTGPDGGTPTEPAERGALDYAKTIKATGKNVAIVLATDGQPNDCSSDVNGVGNIAASGVTDGIKTYVIGVGSSTGNLNSIAADGDTTAAIMIPTTNPAQVSADLIKALGGIASSLLGCTYALPSPPAGQTLDVTKVNVNFTPPSAPATTLAYSADCSNKDGWHYDNTAAPTQILLCDAACTTAKNTAGAKLDVIFGCTTAAKPGEGPR